MISLHFTVYRTEMYSKSVIVKRICVCLQSFPATPILREMKISHHSQKRCLASLYPSIFLLLLHNDYYLHMKMFCCNQQSARCKLRVYLMLLAYNIGILSILSKFGGSLPVSYGTTLEHPASQAFSCFCIFKTMFVSTV